jgi:hypothetical protein
MAMELALVPSLPLRDNSQCGQTTRGHMELRARERARSLFLFLFLLCAALLVAF